MRVECEACRELFLASFGIEGGAVRATCPVCRHVMSVPSTPREVAAPGAPPIGPPPCPKCGAALRGEATACPSCGLTVARMAAYTEARDAALPDVGSDVGSAAVPAAVQDAWARVIVDWNDPARHDELLQRAAATHAYAWAAGRYRTRGRDAIAQRQLDRLRRAAEATLLASATARPDASAKPYRATRRVLAVLITTIAAGALYAMVIRDHPLASSARPIPARLVAPGHPISPSPGK